MLIWKVESMKTYVAHCIVSAYISFSISVTVSACLIVVFIEDIFCIVWYGDFCLHFWVGLLPACSCSCYLGLTSTFLG